MFHYLSSHIWHMLFPSLCLSKLILLDTKSKGGGSKWFGHPLVRKQVITKVIPYQVTCRDKDGNPIMQPELNKKGKPTGNMIPVTETFYNRVVKVINHYTNDRKKGRTLGEMVYASYKAQ